MPCAVGCTAIMEAHAACQHHRLLRSCAVRLHSKRLASTSQSGHIRRPQGLLCLAMRSASRVQAYKKPLQHGHDDSFYNSTPVVDTTAEEVSTSGRGSDDDRDPEHRPNILKRAATAAVGLASAFLNWLKSNARLKRLLDRWLSFCCLKVAIKICLAAKCKALCFHVCRRFLLYIVYSLLGFIFMSTVRFGINSVTAKPPQEVRQPICAVMLCSCKQSTSIQASWVAFTFWRHAVEQRCSMRLKRLIFII